MGESSDSLGPSGCVGSEGPQTDWTVERCCDDCGQPYFGEHGRCGDCAIVEQEVRSWRWQPPHWCKLPTPPFYPVLEVYQGGFLVQNIPLHERRTFVFGRREASFGINFAVGDPSVCTPHAALICSSRAVFVQDLGSISGTWIDITLDRPGSTSALASSLAPGPASARVSDIGKFVDSIAVGESGRGSVTPPSSCRRLGTDDGPVQLRLGSSGVATTVRLGKAGVVFRVVRQPRPAAGTAAPYAPSIGIVSAPLSAGDGVLAPVCVAAEQSESSKQVTPSPESLLTPSRALHLAAPALAPHLVPPPLIPSPYLQVRGVIWRGILATFSTSQGTFRQVAEFVSFDMDSAHLPSRLDFRFCKRPSTGGLKRLTLTAAVAPGDRESNKQMSQLASFLIDRKLACHLFSPTSGRDIFAAALLLPNASQPWRVECLLGPKQRDRNRDSKKRDRPDSSSLEAGGGLRQ